MRPSRASSWSSRRGPPATSATRSGTRWSRRSCTTSSSPASAGCSIEPTPKRSRRARPATLATPRGTGRARPSLVGGTRRPASVRGWAPRRGCGRACVRVRGRAYAIRDASSSCGPSSRCRRDRRHRPRQDAEPRGDDGGARRRANRNVALRREAVAAEAGSDPVRAAVLRESLGRALFNQGDTKAAIEVSEAAVALIPPSRPNGRACWAVTGSC